MLFSVIVGSGYQIGMGIYAIISSQWSGLINPYFRIMHYFMLSVILAAGTWINGAVTARLMKYFGHNGWETAAKGAAFFVPAWILCVVFTVDFIDWVERAK